MPLVHAVERQMRLLDQSNERSTIVDTIVDLVERTYELICIICAQRLFEFVDELRRESTQLETCSVLSHAIKVIIH